MLKKNLGIYQCNGYTFYLDHIPYESNGNGMEVSQKTRRKIHEILVRASKTMHEEINCLDFETEEATL